jgi:hypothetical protein
MLHSESEYALRRRLLILGHILVPSSAEFNELVPLLLLYLLVLLALCRVHVQALALKFFITVLLLMNFTLVRDDLHMILCLSSLNVSKLLLALTTKLVQKSMKITFKLSTLGIPEL